MSLSEKHFKGFVAIVYNVVLWPHASAAVSISSVPVCLFGTDLWVSSKSSSFLGFSKFQQKTLLVPEGQFKRH